MHLTLLLPDLCRLAGAGRLLPWLARGDRLAGAAPGREAQLRECFEFMGTSLPVAALTRSLDAHDAQSAQWLRCDPAYVMADAVTLRLLACGNMDLSTNEVTEFSKALKPLFGDAGFLLEADRPDRWYLRCPREAKLPPFSDPADALGDDLARHLPDGDNARRWRGLLNEAQIILTQHPLNVQRASRGQAPLNSVWFWGAGALPEWGRCSFDRVVSDDDVVTALARLAKVTSFPRTRGFQQPNGGSSSTFLEQETPSLDPRVHAYDKHMDKVSVLIDLADQRDVAMLERDWLASIGAQISKRKLTEVRLHFLSGERYTIKPAHRWRFWRRAKS